MTNPICIFLLELFKNTKCLYRGISASRRRVLWQIFSQADELKYNSARSYESLLLGVHEKKSKEDVEDIMDTINKDVERTCVEVKACKILYLYTKYIITVVVSLGMCRFLTSHLVMDRKHLPIFL